MNQKSDNTKGAYRVTVKVRNARLLRAIEEKGHSPGSKVAALIGIPYTTLNDYVNLTRSPLDRDGLPTESAEKIMVFFNKMISELWDENQLHALESNKKEVEASFEELIAIEAARPRLIENPERAVLDGEIARLMHDATSAIHERSRAALLKHEYEGKTYTEIGDELGVCRVRARQMKAIADRNIRLRFAKSGVNVDDYIAEDA